MNQSGVRALASTPLSSQQQSVGVRGNALRIDPTLARHVSLFHHGGSCIVKSGPDNFVRVSGEAASLVESCAAIGSHPALEPAFAAGGYLTDPKNVAPSARIGPLGTGALHAAVTRIFEHGDLSPGDNRTVVSCLFTDDVPLSQPDAAVVVWPEGEHVFIGPGPAPAGYERVTIVHIQRRRIAASPHPELTEAWLSEHRRATPRISADEAVVVCAALLSHLNSPAHRHRRLRVVDLRALAWEDHLIFPIPCDVRPVA